MSMHQTQSPHMSSHIKTHIVMSILAKCPLFPFHLYKTDTQPRWYYCIQLCLNTRFYDWLLVAPGNLHHISASGHSSASLLITSRSDHFDNIIPDDNTKNPQIRSRILLIKMHLHHRPSHCDWDLFAIWCLFMVLYVNRLSSAWSITHRSTKSRCFVRPTNQPIVSNSIGVFG